MKPRWKSVFVCIFLLFGLSMFLCVRSGPARYMFHAPMTQYSLFVLKVSLNTNKPNQTTYQLTTQTIKYENKYHLLQGKRTFLNNNSKHTHCHDEFHIRSRYKEVYAYLR